MQDWEKKFDSVALGRGRNLFNSGKVEELKRTEDHISAAITGIPRYEVSITLQENIPVRMKCQCPKYRSGRSCEHMAAVLYAVYGTVAATWNQDESGQLNMFGELRQEAIAAAAERIADKTAQRPSRKEAASKAARKAAEEAAHKAEEAARKAAEEAAKKEAEEEAAREAACKEAAERIARREEIKKAKRAERKRKRLEAEQAQREAALEAARKREEEERKAAEEAARKAAKEEERKEAERAARKAAEEEAARKKEQKIQAAIARASRQEPEPQTAEAQDRKYGTDGYCYYNFNRLRELLRLSEDNINKGKKLYRNGSLRLDEISGGYTDTDENLVLDVTGMCRSGKKNFPIGLFLQGTGSCIMNAAARNAAGTAMAGIMTITAGTVLILQLCWRRQRSRSGNMVSGMLPTEPERTSCILFSISMRIRYLQKAGKRKPA